jgi:hypothetical protein
MRSVAFIAVIFLGAALGVWRGGRTSNAQVLAAARKTLDSSTAKNDAAAAALRANGNEQHDERDAHYTRLISALLESDRLAQRHKLYEAIGAITSADIDGLIARADKLPLAYREHVLSALVERWFEVDADAARAWVRRRGDWAFIQIRAHHEPARVIDELLATRTDRFSYRDVFSLKTAIEQIAGSDAIERFAQVASFPPSKLRDQLAAALLAEWGADDPVAAIEKIDTIADKDTRDEIRNQLLTSIAGKDPSKAFELAGELVSHLNAGIVGNRTLTEITDAAAEKNPQAAMEFALSLPEEFRYYPAMAAARALAKNDPVTALNWCLENGIDVARGLRTGAGGGWTGAVLKEAMLNHPRETIDWVMALPSEDERNPLLERAFYERLNNLPPEKLFLGGSDYVLELFDQLPDEARPRTANDLSRQRATRPDFTNPNEWLSQFRTVEERAAAIQGVITGIASRDTKEAEALAASFAVPRDRDTALSALVGKESWQNPESAGKRLLQIQDPTVRKDALQLLIPNWMQRDKSACQAWIAEHQVPQQWVDRWLGID